MTVPHYNLYVRIHEVKPTTASQDGEGEGYVTPVKLEVKTIKEGRIREKVLVQSNTDETKSMEVCHIMKHLHYGWLAMQIQNKTNNLHTRIIIIMLVNMIHKHLCGHTRPYALGPCSHSLNVHKPFSLSLSY